MACLLYTSWSGGEQGFPHNLRHLFARCYYEKEKDLVRLADYVIIRERGLLSVRMAGFFVAKKENI